MEEGEGPLVGDVSGVSRRGRKDIEKVRWGRPMFGFGVNLLPVVPDPSAVLGPGGGGIAWGEEGWGSGDSGFTSLGSDGEEGAMGEVTGEEVRDWESGEGTWW